jgi:hypothetical protein
MAEGDPRKPSKPDNEPEIGKAELLFRDDPRGPSAKHAPNPPPNPSSGSKDVFDLVAEPESPDPAPPSAAPAGPTASRKGPARGPRQPRADRSEDPSQPDPSELVEQVWSRMAEWGQTLIVLGIWLAFVGFLIYMLLDAGLGPAFLAFLVGAAVAVVLSYPILITLERPVRVTPEQAVRDYYAALSHHLPHYKRMWLLLSTAGRVSSAFGSFEGFKKYWKDRLARLREGHAGSMTPLVFVVADFKAEKSAGRTQIDAEFSVSVLVRGRRQAGPIQKFPMRIALVRGPDSMWYLEDGTLSSRERTAQSAQSAASKPRA